MANDEILTIKDLFELHLAGARLATLSACETGVPGTKLPDEVVSLPSAFIRAGFAGAVGSLWTVQMIAQLSL
jgi:CHAT domain-containing protein